MLKAGLEAALAGVLIALAVPLRVPGCRRSSPLRATERRLHPWSTLFVVPVFAFFNAGIAIDATTFENFVEPVPLGIIAGLFLGKQMRISGACWAAVRLSLAQLPSGVNWAQIYGTGLIAGIGFTMSLFVATLAFDDPVLVTSAKLAILVASLLSAAVGLTVIAGASPSESPESHNADALTGVASTQRERES